MQINLAPDSSLLVIVAIFLVNYWVVRKFYLKPINDIITDRRSEVQGAERLYEEALAHFNEAAAAMESRLHDARKKGSEVRERLRSEAVRVRTESIEQSRKNAEEIVLAAEQEIAGEVENARTRILEDADRLARLTAEQVLGRPLA